jgi:hypothetical protein
LTVLERGEIFHRLLHVLPGAAAVLFTTRTRMFGDWERARIDVYVRATGERSVLVEGGADARYVSREIFFITGPPEEEDDCRLHPDGP